MKEISRSIRQAKQGKFLDADCTCPYNLYGDMEGPHMSYSDDVAVVYWLVVGVLDGDMCQVDGE